MESQFIYAWSHYTIDSLTRKFDRIIQTIDMETIHQNTQQCSNHQAILYQIKDLVCELKTASNELLEHRMCFMFNSQNYKFDYSITMIAKVIDNLYVCIMKSIKTSKYKGMANDITNINSNRFKCNKTFKSIDEYKNLLIKIDKMFYKRRILKLPKLIQALHPNNSSILLCFEDYMNTITKYLKRFIDIANERLINCPRINCIVREYEIITINRMLESLMYRSFLICFAKYSNFSMYVFKPRILVDLNECAIQYKQSDSHITFLDLAYSQSTCIICLEQKVNHSFTISKDCSHAFCSTCTNNLIMTSIQQYNKNIFPCPVCRTKLCANDSFYYINKTIPSRYTDVTSKGLLQCSKRQLNRSPWNLYSRSSIEKNEIAEKIYTLSASDFTFNEVLGEVLSINFD